MLRKKVLNNRYYENVANHAKAIDEFIQEINAGLQAKEMDSLITLNFQLFHDLQIAVA